MQEQILVQASSLLFQHFLHRGQGQIRAIVMLAEMRQKHMHTAFFAHPGQTAARFQIRLMTARAEDAFFEILRVGTATQHRHIVI